MRGIVYSLVPSVPRLTGYDGDRPTRTAERERPLLPNRDRTRLRHPEPAASNPTNGAPELSAAGEAALTTVTFPLPEAATRPLPPVDAAPASGFLHRAVSPRPAASERAGAIGRGITVESAL